MWESLDFCHFSQTVLTFSNLKTAKNSPKLQQFSDFQPISRYPRAIDSATSALELDSGNCKALYRRGVAQLRQGAVEEAKVDLLKALGWGWGMDGMDTTWDMGEIIEKEMETTIYDISISQIFIHLSF